jgi:3-deoxy-D-manno-octulosonic-acid transferase
MNPERFPFFPLSHFPMLLLYNLLWLLLFPFIIVLFPLISLGSDKKRKNWLQHFGFVTIHPKKAQGEKIIWLQAVSVGEIATAEPIIKELKKAIGAFSFVVSVTTEAGYRQAQKIFPDAMEIFFTPMDFYPAIARLIKKIRPVAILIIETGFWPNLLYCGNKSGASVVLVNGRISEKSFRNYKVLAPLAKALFNKFHLLITRDATVSNRFKDLGVQEGKILSFGDVKYDTLPAFDQASASTFLKLFSIAPEEKIIMAGNTHEGEERYLLDIFDELKIRFPKTLLIIAPRRLERIPGIEALLRENGKSYVKRTTLKDGNPRKSDIILLDTIGELSRIYFICDVIFVGKSIFPPGGGHSLLEPVAAGKVAFHGPYVQYYEEAKEVLKNAGLAVELEDKAAFIEHFSKILEDENKKEEISKKTVFFLSERKGASKKIAAVLSREIEGAAMK